MIVIAIPAYDRPEFFAETARTLNASIKSSGLDVRVIVYVDRHDNEDTREQVVGVAHSICSRELTVVERPSRIGGSRNNTESILHSHDATGSEWIVYLESDLIVARSFVRFMSESIGMFSRCENVLQISTGHYDINYKKAWRCPYTISNWPSSMGVAINMSAMTIFKNDISKFIDSPQEYAESVRHMLGLDMDRALFPDGKSFFNGAWGGMMAIQAAVGRLSIVHSTKPYSTHIGWHGWHLSEETQRERGVSTAAGHSEYIACFDERL